MVFDAQKGDFAIEVNLDPGTSDPARIFESLSSLIRAIENIDREFARNLDPNASPVLVLQGLEVGSLRTWFISTLHAIPDDALRELDWKKIVGTFLVKAKYRLLRFLGDRNTVQNVDEVQRLQAEIEDLKAEVTRPQALPVANPIPAKVLLGCVQQVARAIQPLPPQQKVAYLSPEGTLPLNRNFSITNEQIRDLIAPEVKTNEAEMVLKVKKPDYLGDSKWDMQLQGRLVQVKIADEPWLHSFHNREIDLRPGDSLQARVRVEAHLDDQGQAHETKHTVLEVRRIVTATAEEQLELFSSGEGSEQPPITPPH